MADELLGATDTERPVASATGTVLTYGQGRQPAVAEVLSVEAGPADTLLRWRLKSTGPLLPLNPSTLRQSENSGVDAVDVALVDPAEQKLFLPPRFKTQDDFRCVCSLTPNAVDGRGQVLTGLYSLLSQGAGVVEVRIPGFPTIPNVPVKRG